MIRAYLSTGFREWDKHIPLKAMSLHSEKMFDGLLSQYAHVGLFVCLFVCLLYVPSQQLWSLRDGQFT